METIDIFLRALERRLGFKEKFFVCRRSTTIDEKFHAYKKYVMEIWCIDGSYNHNISTVQIVERVTTQEEKQQIEIKLLGQTYENILRYYGI